MEKRLWAIIAMRMCARCSLFFLLVIGRSIWKSNRTKRNGIERTTAIVCIINSSCCCVNSLVFVTHCSSIVSACLTYWIGIVAEKRERANIWYVNKRKANGNGRIQKIALTYGVRWPTLPAYVLRHNNTPQHTAQIVVCCLFDMHRCIGIAFELNGRRKKLLNRKATKYVNKLAIHFIRAEAPTHRHKHTHTPSTMHGV